MRGQYPVLPLLIGALGVSALAVESRKVQPKCWYGSDFPDENDWLSFEELFNKWKPSFKAQGDTDTEITQMENAIKTQSQNAGVNPALATAMMIQESQGNTCRVCGDGGISCGLFQVKGSSNECAGKSHPCAEKHIEYMVQCGITGCGAQGSNIQACKQKYSSPGATLRCYNSGEQSVNISDLRIFGTGDKKYVHQIANTLLGADQAKLNELGGATCGF
ncbi:hypothetical protein F4778DRAFT_401993 [Xylariomycetidae sp. FL2044]|nr:hypothetical protein F4778DRAFT_401993 [Xylariomycetidae sp. FL2044]